MDKRRDIIRNFDYKLLLNIVLLCIFGLIVLRSATLSLNNQASIMSSQRVATFLGFGVLVFLSIVDYRHWKYLYKFIYILSIGLLVATLFIGHGPSAGSAIRSWISIGGFNFQPSEFVKIAFIICLASYLEEVHEDLNKPATLIKVLLFAFFPIFLILRQPDTGTALVYIFITVLMLFIAGIHWKYILAAIVVMLIAAPILWFFRSRFKSNRYILSIYPR